MLRRELAGYTSENTKKKDIVFERKDLRY